MFFGEKYRVLRGGSFATRAVVARNTFRNWDLPQRRQVFAGFSLCVVGVRPSLSPGLLAATLAALEVRVDTAHVTLNAVRLSDYASGPRPSGVVRLNGRGVTGTGENVAFLAQEQERFGTFIEGWLSVHAGSRLHVGSALGTEGTPLRASRARSRPARSRDAASQIEPS